MVYIYGAGGHGKVVLYTLTANKNVIAFIDDNKRGEFCGVPILSPPEIQDLHPYSIHFAIGNNQIRSQVQIEFQELGITAETVSHSTSICYPTAIIGAGCLLAAGSVIGPDCVIGKGCIVNHNAIIDHDCTIGDFCHIAPSATLGGSVTLGEQCLVGANATILPNLTIGRLVTIGAGAVVTHNIPDNSTIAGCPARPI